MNWGSKHVKSCENHGVPVSTLVLQASLEPLVDILVPHVATWPHLAPPGPTIAPGIPREPRNRGSCFIHPVVTGLVPHDYKWLVSVQGKASMKGRRP